MRDVSRLIGALIFASAVAGCSSIGPMVIKRDRTDYSGAMASSWKEQMLLNIVKFRYFDPPVFVDVSSVVSSQELGSALDVTSQFYPNPASIAGSSGSSGGGRTGASGIDFWNLRGSGHYTDHPTISYTPLTGNRFINSLLRPIPPLTIFSMIDAGHDAGFILPLAVRSINGIYNYSLAPAQAHPENPEFRELIDAIRRIQRAGAINTRTARTGKLSRTWILFQHNVAPAVNKDIRLVKRLLRLAPQRDQFLLTGRPNHTYDEIAVRTRSMQEILTELAAGVQVPIADVADRRATSVPSEGRGEAPLILIHSSSIPPTNAYTAAFYRGRWFWVDDDDLRSKRVFMFLLIFSALSETRAVPQVPIVTIPTN